MNSKWYFGALIVILALFGISQEKMTTPNQEIVLQFSNNTIASNQLEFVVSNVKKQLEIIGVSEVEVRKEPSGRIIISYYSNTNVDSVKSIFSSEKLTVDYTSKDDNSSNSPKNKTYNLDVFEIQKSSDTGVGSNGKLFLELKQDYDRFSNPNVFVYASTLSSTNKNIEIFVAYKQNKTIAAAINNIPYKIPEGRAGPIL